MSDLYKYHKEFLVSFAARGTVAEAQHADEGAVTETETVEACAREIEM